MLFNSPEFLFFFLPTVLLIFFLIGARSSVWALGWLVLSSLFFYGWWNPSLLGLILLSIGINFALGRYLVDLRADHQKRLLLAIGVMFNLAVIGYFKYADFFIASVNAFASTNLPILNIVLPIGISFFTFQQIAFLVDARNGVAAERNLLRYSLFVVFFPQLIAGPIVHHSDVLPQFQRSSTFHPRMRNLSVGISIFFIGLFKKVVLADNFALIASPVFASAENGVPLDFMTSLQGALGYTFQLYFDFSGYSDMAIGLARLFGVRLPLNFNSPYKATSIIDFWRRWHMTLSRFLREYLYFPLGGNTKGRRRRYVNLLMTMILGGLWHGAGWTFVFWGGLHGVFLVINHAWRRLGLPSRNTWFSILLARSLTFLCVVIGWIFFRAETFGGALNILDGFTHLPANLAVYTGALSGPLSTIGLVFDGTAMTLRDLYLLMFFAAVVLALWIMPNTQEIMSRYRPALLSGAYKTHKPTLEWAHVMSRYLVWRPTWGWSTAIAILAVVSITHLQRVTEFIYYQF